MILDQLLLFLIVMIDINKVGDTKISYFPEEVVILPGVHAHSLKLIPKFLSQLPIVEHTGIMQGDLSFQRSLIFTDMHIPKQADPHIPSRPTTAFRA